MHLVMAGLSHHTAPVDVREQLTCPDGLVPEALARILQDSTLDEAVLLSTCNRVELYAASEAPAPDAFHAILAGLSRVHELPVERFAQHLQNRSGSTAAKHLMRVASGLDSQVLGESQILGQVRNALMAARRYDASGKLLSRLFEHAIAAGRRVRSETSLGSGGFSVGHAAVELARSIFDDLSRASVLLIGAGKMSEMAAQHLTSSGATRITVANRTRSRADELAALLHGISMDYDEALRTGIAHSDIIITSTASPRAIITRDGLAPAVRARRGRPLFLVDIAVPRDVDPAVINLENVFLYNIDDLEASLQGESAERAAAVDLAEQIVDEEAARFEAWRRSLAVTPVIADLRQTHQRITEEYLQIYRSRLGHLPPKDWGLIEEMARSMMEQAVRTPIQALKSAASSASGEDLRLIDAAQQLYSRDEQAGAGRVQQSGAPQDGAEAVDARPPAGDAEAQPKPGSGPLSDDSHSASAAQKAPK